MKRTLLARGAHVAAAGGVAVVVTACSAGGGAAAQAGASSSGRSSAAAPATSSAAPPAGQPFGPACPQLPATGPGSPQAMSTGQAVSTAPLVTAASTNPQLTTLVQAVAKANLVDTLNTTPEITVLAPANQAFAAVPPPTLAAVLADTPALTQLLTHHVLPGRLGPEKLTGEQSTLANDKVTLQGSGPGLTVSGDQTLSGQPAKVLCGNLRTANATVYVVDQVLRPRKAG